MIVTQNLLIGSFTMNPENHCLYAASVRQLYMGSSHSKVPTSRVPEKTHGHYYLKASKQQ